MSSVTNVTEANFEQQVLQAETPFLLDFWAEWCGPCRKLALTMDEIARERTGSLSVGAVNADLNPDLVARLRITSMPSVLLFKEGKLVERILGALPKQQLIERITPHLS